MIGLRIAAAALEAARIPAALVAGTAWNRRAECGVDVSHAGNPAVMGKPGRPVALRPSLSRGVPFQCAGGSLLAVTVPVYDASPTIADVM